MSQPRPNSQFRSLSERYFMHRHYVTEYSQQPYRSHSKKLARKNNMSGVLPVDPMDVDCGSVDGHSVKNESRETFLEDEKFDEQFEMVNHDTTGDAPIYSHPNETTGLDSKSKVPISGILDDNKIGLAADALNDTSQLAQIEQVDQLPTQEIKVDDTESFDMQSQLQQQINDLSSKITSLESNVIRQPSTEVSQQRGEENGLSNESKKRYTVRIIALEKTLKEMEEQIHNLLNAQEPVMKYQSGLEARYRAALSHIEKEERAREERELDTRTEVTTMRGAYQKEKERAQKLMKTMAEMQRADPFKIDNTSITSSVKELRYDIKNWAWAQRLVPSLPAQGLLSSYASRALGGREKGPNYEFLKDVTPVFNEYTESPQDFKWVLQAYVWKRLVDLVFYDDLWTGIRKAMDEVETDYKLQLGYRLMKLKLAPDEESRPEYIAQFHDWRSTTARILDQRVSPDRRKRTVEAIRDEILSPLYKAAEPTEQEIRNVEDLEAVIESAMRLVASMAQQKACFKLEFVPLALLGKLEFNQQSMKDPFPVDGFDQRFYSRTVWLNLAPRLVKYGTSEGTDFDTCVQLLEGEVETKIAPRKFTTRRHIVN